MHPNQTTRIPNGVIDTYMPQLTESELKVLLVVLRQTVGWVDRRTGKRKERDRISKGQFVQKTGLSKRVITKAIQSLINKQLLRVTDYQGILLPLPHLRKGKSYLFYSPPQPVHIPTPSRAQRLPEPVHNCYHNKSKRVMQTKRIPHFSGHVAELLAKKGYYQQTVT